MMGFGGIFGILLIGVIVWAVIRFTDSNNSKNSPDTNRGRIGKTEGDALDILKERCARGEINREEYERIKQDLK